jgi:CheY-like chemotaxis protein
MFESLRRQRSASPGTPGRLGVGLAVVKRLVELHGGRVRAESADGQTGATFTVELPLVSEQRPLAGIRVLLVDDDADIREAFQAVLEARGAEVTAADSVAGALAALERSRPDVLLSELAMPRQSGYDLIRELVARDPSLPAAALTKYSRPEESRRALAAGFHMHLAKPIEVDTLVTAVARLAGRRVPKRSSAGDATK